jgi:hypothetical protein
MAKKIEKTIPWITILVICLMVFTAGGMVLKEAGAVSITPSVGVGNAPPSAIASITLNGGTAIIVVGNSSTTIYGSTTVTDPGGWTDISSATATLFHNATATCDDGTVNPNWCYYDSNCTMGATTSNTRIVTCSADVWFVGEPTAGTGSVASPGDWQMDITVTDGGGNATTATTSVELNTLWYADVDSTIAYGAVELGATSSEKTTTATNQGNSPIDFEISGVDMEDNGNSIIADQQHYSSSTLGDWGGTALTSTVANIDLTLPKPTSTTSPDNDDIYWMIKIPDAQASGTYTGTTTATIIDKV